VLKDTFEAKVFINVCICSLATYFGSLVTQLLANLDVLVYPNKRCRRAYNHISLKMAHDPKRVVIEEYKL
jgi:hypothetical protein